MHDAFKQLQVEYIDALRPVIADTLRWWNAHCPYPHTEPRAYDEMHPFHRRWIAGPAAHPRVIAVFREYFFRVQELNDRARAAPPGADDVPKEELWGQDAAPAWVPLERPIDLLVNDLAGLAPDLHEVMQGLVFIPIGMDPHNQEC
jgi:hypothetical protein